MALIYCPECKKQISDTTKRCIHCGYKIKSNSNYQKNIFNSFLTKTKNDFDRKKYIKITIYFIIFVLFIILFCIFLNFLLREKSYKRNVSDVFGFNFSMTKADIIQFEKQEFGNLEYIYEKADNDSRYDVLRFERSYFDNDSWKHSYYIDSKTGELSRVSFHGVNYKDSNNGFYREDECVHISEIVTNLAFRIGKWDKKIGNWKNKERDYYAFKAYANIDGVKCTIYYDTVANDYLIINKN